VSIKKLAIREAARRIEERKQISAVASTLLSTLFPQQLAFATDTADRAIARQTSAT
jgi:hypothetical protein